MSLNIVFIMIPQNENPPGKRLGWIQIPGWDPPAGVSAYIVLTAKLFGFTWIYHWEAR